jgi:hypothetical protein
MRHALISLARKLIRHPRSRQHITRSRSTQSQSFYVTGEDQ